MFMTIVGYVLDDEGRRSIMLVPVGVNPTSRHILT